MLFILFLEVFLIFLTAHSLLLTKHCEHILRMWMFLVYFVIWLYDTQQFELFNCNFKTRSTLISNALGSAYHNNDHTVFYSPDVILCGWLGLKHQLT